jgi:ribosomal protein S26
LRATFGGKIRACRITRTREEVVMCANCGCGIPEDKHGDDRNIAWSQIVASAEANDLSPADAVGNMQEMARQQG